MTLPLPVMGHLGIWLLALGFAASLGLSLADPGSLVRRSAVRYTNHLDAQTKFLFLDRTGAQYLRAQMVLLMLVLLVGVLLFDLTDPNNVAIIVIVCVVIFLVPVVQLRSARQKRVEKLEVQLDGWLLILANALKATPSLGDAMAASAKIVQTPMAEELDLMLKETRLGSPLDQAIVSMTDRIGSRSIAGAMATILIGRQTGGDMSRILEESAATLREMSRLEGVVRTKTAEGKSQALILGAMPFVLLVAIHFVDDQWLLPLTNTTAGFIVLVVAGFLWVSAILLARRILAVDI